MNIGDAVAIVSHKGFEGFETIVAVGVLSHCSYGQRCYVLVNNSKFYMEPDLVTGKLFKVDDSSVWIEKPPVLKTLVETIPFPY